MGCGEREVGGDVEGDRGLRGSGERDMERDSLQRSGGDGGLNGKGDREKRSRLFDLR